MPASALQRRAVTRRAPLAARLGRDWVYLDRAGSGGLGGWIAPHQALDDRHIEIVVGDAAVRAPLRVDAEPIEGRTLYRFECALPLSKVNLVTLRFDQRAVSLLTLDRGPGRAPFFARVPMEAHRAAGLPPVNGRTLIVLSPIDWSFRRQRSQQLTAALSTHYDTTLYLGPASLQLAGAAVAVEGCAVRLPLLGTAPDCDFSERLMTGAEAEATAAALRGQMGESADVILQFPSWRQVAERLPSARLIYDCIDFHRALPHVTARLAETEAALVREASLCLATSTPLLEHVRSLGAKSTLLVPNAATAPQIEARPASRRASVLYVGAIESWFDFALVEALARAMPETAIELVGQSGVPAPVLPRNVVMLGERTHAQAIKAMMQARVGIIPFKREALIASVNPVKAYEYLSAGLPVVMTPMGGDELAGAPGVTVAETPEAFIAALRAAFVVSDAERRCYAAWAEAQTWDARARAIIERLADV